MLEKSRKAVFFQWFRVSGQSKSRPVKAAGAEVGAQRRNQKLHAAVGETQIWKWKCTKHVSSEALFCCPDVKKLHAAVARSTLWSQNVQNTSWWEHFWKFWCAKIARTCGEKRICKWKCTKHVSSEALFAVLMSKNCTPLWRKAHFEVNMLKNWGSGSTFLKFWCRKIARGCGEKQILKWECTKHVSSGQFLEVLMSKNQSGSKLVS